MKLRSGVLFIATGLCISTSVKAQTSQNLQSLQENIETVSIDDEQYEQAIESINNDCIVSIGVNNVEEAEETTYQFNAADINPYKVTFDTKRQRIIITAETMGSRNLIQKSESGEIDGYDDKLEFYALDIENARTVVEYFKAFVEACQAQQENVDFVLGDTPSIDEALIFLQNNIHELKVNDKQLNQEFSVDNSFKALTQIRIVDEIESETMEYRFNIADVNPTTINFTTDDEFVLIEGETKGERDLIEIYENGEKDNYDDNFSFYSENIEEARKLTAVLKYFAESAENISNTELDRIDGFNDIAQLNAHLSNKVVDVVIEDDNYKQTYEPQQENPFIVTFIHEYINDGERNEYLFNLSDIDENSIHFDTRKNEINIEVQTVGKNEVIQHRDNGELDNYEDEISIRSTDIEAGRVLVKTLKKAVETAKEQYQPAFLSANPNPSKSQVQQFLRTAMEEVVIGDDAFEQSIEFDDESDCLLVYTVHDISDGEILDYKFNLKDINVYKVTSETKRKEVYIHLETEGENDLIEVIEDGETDDFENEVNIRAAGIEEARSIVSAFKALITICDAE